jgi:hypothetical protein
MNPERKASLRDAVLAWVEAEKVAAADFESVRDTINRELDAVGGYATTSVSLGKNNVGYCRSFHRMDDGFGGGVEREGEKYGGTGPNAETTAPHHPEVGDRCFALDNAHRDLELKVYAARKVVEEIAVGLLTGAMPPGVKAEVVALAARALVLSERATEGPVTIQHSDGTVETWNRTEEA